MEAKTMKIKNRKIIITFAVLVVMLGCFYYFKSVRRDEVQPLPALFNSPSEPIKFEIKNKNSNIVLEMQKHEWKVVLPVEKPAKKTVVEQLKFIFTNMPVVRVISESAENLSVFGLEPAKMEVKAFFASGTTGILLIGNKNPTEQYYYVRKNNERIVYLEPAQLLEIIGSGAESFCASRANAQ